MLQHAFNAPYHIQLDKNLPQEWKTSDYELSIPEEYKVLQLDYEYFALYTDKVHVVLYARKLDDVCVVSSVNVFGMTRNALVALEELTERLYQERNG